MVKKTDGEFTVVEHLDELRRRVLISLSSLIAAAVISMPLAQYFLKILKLPASGSIDKLVFFSPEEAFVIYMQISFLAGAILSLPVILFQIWRFISPAVGSKKKSSVAYFVFFSSAAFVTGCLFAYYMIIPNALKFLLNLGGDDLVPMISAGKYISFVTGLIIASGVIFEMPIASFFLARAGLINEQLLWNNFKYAVVVIFIIAAVITPTGDAFNMSILAIPMIFLYVVSIMIAKVAYIKKGEC